MHIIYEKTKGQIPPRPSLGKQNIQAKEVYWRDCGTDYGDLDNNSSNSAFKHSLQLSMANCLLSNKLAQYIWTCHCVKFATLTQQTNETEIIRQCMQMQCQKKLQQPSYVQTDATSPNTLAPHMLHVVASVLRWRGNRFNNSQQHATGCANRRNMQHPAMLHPFARGFKSVASGQ